MSKERDAEVEELGTDLEESKGFPIGFTTIILGVIITLISIVFLYLLSAKTGAPFGAAQILYSIALGVIILFFFYWLNLFMQKNPYLALIIGIAALGASIYALFIKYRGPYTTAFAIISAVIVLIYLFIYFFKARKN